MDKEQNEEVQSSKIVEEKGNSADDSAMQDAMIAFNIKSLRELRKRTDGLVHIVKGTSGDSMEKLHAATHLMVLRGWFQDILEYLGQDAINMPNNTSIHSFNDIQDDTDKSDVLKVQVKKVTGKTEVLTDANDIESLNHVRRDLAYIESQVNQLVSITETVYETFIFQHVREAKFWLDQELFRIKKVAKEKIFSQTQQGNRLLSKRPEKTQPIFSNLQARAGGKGSIIRPPVMNMKKSEPEIKVEVKHEAEIPKENTDGKAESETGN